MAIVRLAMAEWRDPTQDCLSSASESRLNSNFTSMEPWLLAIDRGLQSLKLDPLLLHSHLVSYYKTKGAQCSSQGVLAEHKHMRQYAETTLFSLRWPAVPMPKECQARWVGTEVVWISNSFSSPLSGGASVERASRDATLDVQPLPRCTAATSVVECTVTTSQNRQTSSAVP